jgi:hypothetical protein
MYDFKTIAKQYYNQELPEYLAFNLYPQLELIVNKLGRERLKAKGFNITKLTLELNDLINSERVDINEKIEQLFSNAIIKPTLFNFYSNKNIKEQLVSLYKENGLTKKVTSNIVEEVLKEKGYEVTKCSRTIDGRKVLGYRITKNDTN